MLGCTLLATRQEPGSWLRHDQGRSPGAVGPCMWRVMPDHQGLQPVDCLLAVLSWEVRGCYFTAVSPQFCANIDAAHLDELRFPSQLGSAQ